MEQSEKKSLKISIFDIVIVALCLVAAAVVFMMLKPKNVTVGTPSGTPMRYTVEIQKMPAGAGELVQPGDAIKDGAKNYDIGTVVSSTVIPFTYQVTNEENGTAVYVPLDRYENIEIVIEANMNTSSAALTTESGFTVTVGTQVNVAGPCYSGTGYVTSIERGE